jgi:hypothetical protein
MYAVSLEPVGRVWYDKEYGLYCNEEEYSENACFETRDEALLDLRNYFGLKAYLDINPKKSINKLREVTLRLSLRCTQWGVGGEGG